MSMAKYVALNIYQVCSDQWMAPNKVGDATAAEFSAPSSTKANDAGLFSRLTSSCKDSVCCSRGCRSGAGQGPDLLRNDISSAIGRLLVLVNPHSGMGAGRKVFETHVHPALVRGCVNFEAVVTERADHAAEVIALREDLSTFNAIVIVSGDGLVFEVINSILSRSNALRLLDTLPIFLVPCGSGNGLLTSVVSHRGIPYEPEGAFLRASVDALTDREAVSVPVNLIYTEFADRKMASFLSVGMGIMSDVDIESEWYRCFGRKRFIIGALWRLSFLRTYRARLSFLLADSDTPDVDQSVKPVFGNRSRTTSTESESSTSPWEGKLVIDPPDPEGPVPGNWRTVEDEFVNIYAVSLSHISPTGHFAPEARLSQPVIHISYVLKRDVKSRAEVTKYLSAMQTGAQYALPYDRSVRVKAFRLESLDGRGAIVVDGEELKCSAVQCTASTLCLRVGTL